MLAPIEAIDESPGEHFWSVITVCYPDFPPLYAAPSQYPDQVEKEMRRCV